MLESRLRLGFPATSRKTTAQGERNRTFELLVQPHVTPAEGLAIDDVWRQATTASHSPKHPLLRLYEFSGDVFSLGRFHVVPAMLPATDGLQIHRRHSGGRCLPCGEGFVGLSIVLPHRSSLVADEPLALTPPQVLNRCVRGILSGLKGAGIPAFYPGRDWVTVDRRVIAMISFDVSVDGSTLFEAVIACSREFTSMSTIVSSSLPQLAPKLPRLGAHEVTSLKRELGVTPNLGEISALLVRGYAAQYGISFVESKAPPEELRRDIIQRATGSFGFDKWIVSRRIHPTLDHHRTTEALLGTFEAYYSVDPSDTLHRVLLAGDIIANPSAIAELERALVGCPVRQSAVDAVVSRVFARPENFVLGLPSHSSIASTICAGLSPEGVAR